jgi:hypothetical protein
MERKLKLYTCNFTKRSYNSTNTYREGPYFTVAPDNGEATRQFREMARQEETEESDDVRPPENYEVREVSVNGFEITINLLEQEVSSQLSDN